MDTIAPPSIETVERFLDLLSAHDIATATAMFAPDAEVVAPYSPPPLPTATCGREAIAAVFTLIFGAYGRVEFLDRRMMTTDRAPSFARSRTRSAHIDVVVAQWRTDIEVLASGRRYQSEVIAVVELCGGSITRLTEYFNPDALRAAGVI